ncbi:MAG: hypothetical protein HKN09_01280 [Saprospiraceae bacterium]|nr:hypothetical protein [Saprospiraceae bacterium]
MKKINTNTLIIGGECDRQVGPQHAEALHEANPSSQLLILQNMGHVLKVLKEDCSDDLNSYSDASMPLHPELVELVLKFIKPAN